MGYHVRLYIACDGTRRCIAKYALNPDCCVSTQNVWAPASSRLAKRDIIVLSRVWLYCGNDCIKTSKLLRNVFWQNETLKCFGFEMCVFRLKCIFFDGNFSISYKPSVKYISLAYNWQYGSITSDNGLVPSRRQAIIWTINASLGLNELTYSSDLSML